MKSRRMIHYGIIFLCLYSILYVFGQFFFLRTTPDDIRVSIHTSMSPENKNISLLYLQTQWVRNPELYTRDDLLVVYFNTNEKWSIINKHWSANEAALFSKTLFDPSMQPHTIIPLTKDSDQEVIVKAMRDPMVYEASMDQDTFHIMIIHEIKIPFLPPYYWIKDGTLNIQDTKNENIIF